MDKFHLIIACWGKEYVDMFLNVALPCHLSPGNLPAICDNHDLLYKIYTTEEGEACIGNHPALLKLKALVKTRIITIDPADLSGEYGKFSPLIQLHNRAIEEADRDEAGLILLLPDFFMTDGTLSRLLVIAGKGYRAILTLTLRLVKETAIPDFISRYYSPADYTLTASPRESVKVALKHLHPIERSYYWGSNLSSFPIHVYWPTGDEGLIAHCYYLMPILVNPRIRGLKPQLTVDVDYVDLVCPRHSENYVVRDSDELVCFEFTGQAVTDANAEVLEPFRPTPWNLAKWAVVHANPVYSSLLHHWYFQQTIRIHTADLSPRWNKADRESSKIVSQVRWFTFLKRSHRGIGDVIGFYYRTKEDGREPPRFLKKIAELLRFDFSKKKNHSLPSAPAPTALPLEEVGIDYNLYNFPRSNFPEEYSRVLDQWFGRLPRMDRKTVDRYYAESFAVAKIKSKRRVRIDLFGDFYGTGWGETEWNHHGQRWRWLGPDGRAQLFLSLKSKNLYGIKTFIHTADDESLFSLTIEANGQTLPDQQIGWNGTLYYHWCIVPQEVVSQKDGIVDLTYQIKKEGKGNSMALSRVTCRSLKHSVPFLYGRLRSRAGAFIRKHVKKK